MSIAIFLSSFLLTSTAIDQGRAGGVCGGLEQQVASYRLSERDLATFRRVAVHRRSAGLDVLPGFPFCDGVSQAVAEIARDKRSSSLLGAGGMSAKAYVVAGWALIIASNPEVFVTPASSGPGTSSAANRRFAEQHRQEIRSLLFAN